MILKSHLTCIPVGATKMMLILFLTALLPGISLPAQERKLIYNVIRNGNIIGTLDLIELTQGEKRFLSLTSDVKTRFLLTFHLYSSETAAYDGGIMMYSSFFEKQNGSVTANKRTICDGKNYKLVDKEKTEVVTSPPIRYNLLLLYVTIPEKIDKVYSDNHQKLLDIKKVEHNKYRLTLPNGNFNYYTYENGVCTKVEVERTLFTLQFVLTRIITKN